MAAGIPFGLGAFVLFVSIAFILCCEDKMFLTDSMPSQLSSIVYLVQSYGAEAAASGKCLPCSLFEVYCSRAHVAIALAANGCFRYLLGSVFPLFTIQMYENLGVHWAGSVFAFLSLALLPIPWILFKYGHLLRQRSHFIASSGFATESV